MPTPIPTLGYATRTEAVMALTAKGVPARTIADRIGITTGTVAALRHSGARKRRPRKSEIYGRTVVMPVDVLEALRPHALARKISPNELARRIVASVVDDDIVTAVLDDDT